MEPFILIWVFSESHVLRIVYVFPIWITLHLAQHPADNHRRVHIDESGGVHGLVRAAPTLCFVLAGQAKTLWLSASLGWADEAKNRHARNSDGDAAIIKVLSCPPCFRSLQFDVVALARWSWWRNWPCDRHNLFWGATAGARCLMICSRERGYCPCRHSYRFTIWCLGGGRRYCSHSFGLHRGR